MNQTGKIIFGALLLLLILFTSVSLIGYSPLDPPETVSYPISKEIHNYCGRAGATYAWALMNLFGIGSWFLLFCGLMGSIAYWTKSGLYQPVLKAVGMILILTSLCGASSFLLTDYSPGPVYGPGGSLGALVYYAFSNWFSPLGSYIFLASMAITGVILATDSTLVRVFLWISGIHVVSEVVISILRHLRQSAHSRTEEKPESESPVSPSELPSSAAVFRADTDTTKEAPVVFNKNESFAKSSVSTIPQDTVESQDEEEEYEQEVYECPPLEILEAGETPDYDKLESQARSRAGDVENAFASYGYEVKVVTIQSGPILTQYEVKLTTGTRLIKIKSLEPDMELALKSPSVRIVAPIPGRGTVGIEMPNEDRQLVRLRDLMEECADKIEKMAIPLFLGRDVAGNPLLVDLTQLPHLLIAGRTGTGKSVCLNAIIMSILMCRGPAEVRMILIDPKMVELNLYAPIPHLMHAVVTDMRKAEAILGWAVDKMEERLTIFMRSGVRQLSEFNALEIGELKRRVKPKTDEEWEAFPKKLAFVVIVADEMADLMMTAGKEVEQHIIRLSQKSRAVGIHLVLATQKPTVDIITGLIKSNLPARIAFGVASRTDSQVVLDSKGAEQLLGNGDMLFLRPGTSHIVRGQGTFISDKEIYAVINEIGTDKPNFEVDVSTLIEAGEQEEFTVRKRDARYEECVDIIFQHGKGKASTSMLQRFLGLGYNRAARIIDCMVADGIISESKSNKPQQPRDILMSWSQWEAQKESLLSSEAPSPIPSDRKTGRDTFQSNDFIPMKPAPLVPFGANDEKKEERLPSRPRYPRTVIEEFDKANVPEKSVVPPWEPEPDDPDLTYDEKLEEFEKNDSDLEENDFEESDLEDSDFEDSEFEDDYEGDELDEEYEESVEEALDREESAQEEMDEESLSSDNRERWSDDQWNDYLDSWDTGSNKIDEKTAETENKQIKEEENDTI